MKPHRLLVAGGYKGMPLAKGYQTWDVTLLHPDSAAQPDVCQTFDAMQQWPAHTYDHIWCINYLQCHYQHEIPCIIADFWRLLKPTGQLWVRVTNTYAVIEKMVQEKLEPDTPLIPLPQGSLTIHDLIYGWQQQIRTNRHEFYRYKHGFSPSSLRQTLEKHQFQVHQVAPLSDFQLQAQASKICRVLNP